MQTTHCVHEELPTQLSPVDQSQQVFVTRSMTDITTYSTIHYYIIIIHLVDSSNTYRLVHIIMETIKVEQQTEEHSHRDGCLAEWQGGSRLSITY